MHALLDATVELEPSDVLVSELVPSGAPLTVRDAAACAVMAGCTRDQFPLVAAALQAMANPEYQVQVSQVTTILVAISFCSVGRLRNGQELTRRTWLLGTR